MLRIYSYWVPKCETPQKFSLSLTKLLNKLFDDEISCFNFQRSRSVLWIRMTLMWIRMRIRIPLITLMRIRILFLFEADPAANPDSTFSPWCGPGSGSRIQILASKKKGSNPLKSAKIGSYSVHFSLTSANWCGGIQLINIYADPDADPDPDCIWCGSRLPKWCRSLRIRMRIHNTDPDVIKESTFNYPDVRYRYQRINFQRSTGRSYKRIKEPRIQEAIFIRILDPHQWFSILHLKTISTACVPKFQSLSSVSTK